MDVVFLIHHPSGSFSCVVAYQVQTLPLQPRLSLSVMSANSKTQTTKCHVHYVLYTVHWKKSLCSPWPLNSFLCSYLNVLFSSSLLCSERRIWSTRRSYRWNWRTSETSWVRDASTHPLSLSPSVSVFAYDTRTHIQTKLIKDGSTAIQKPGVLHAGHISRLSSAQFVLLL